METIATLFGITKFALSIWDTKTSRKYAERVLRLEEIYYAEENKPEASRNHAVMDNCTHELRLIANSTTLLKK